MAICRPWKEIVVLGKEITNRRNRIQKDQIQFSTRITPSRIVVKLQKFNQRLKDLCIMPAASAIARKTNWNENIYGDEIIWHQNFIFLSQIYSFQTKNRHRTTRSGVLVNPQQPNHIAERRETRRIKSDQTKPTGPERARPEVIPFRGRQRPTAEPAALAVEER